MKRNFGGRRILAERVETAQENVNALEKFPPYDYQKEAAEKAIESLIRTGKALLDMATGLGKTRTAIEVVERIRPKKILVLADSKKLLEDHERTFSIYLGDRYVMGSYVGGKINNVNATIVFATRQRMRNQKEKFAPDEFDLIIDDESHHAMAHTYEPTLHYFKPKGLIGMTATPDRMDWKDIRKIFGHPVVSHTLEEGMRKGWLTPVDYRLVTESVDEAALERLLAEKTENISLDELNERIFKKKGLEETLAHLVENVGERQTAIMCESIEEAEKVAKILRDKFGCQAEGFHTQSDDDHSLQRFRNGSTQFITAVNMMNEGIDVPELGAVAFLRPTDSKRIFLQQLGRVLRKFPGKEKALVLDYVGTVQRLAQINELMRDIKGGAHEKKEGETFFDTTLIGGENVFTFDQKVVEKIGDILHAHERRYSSYADARDKARAQGVKTKGEYMLLKRRKLGLPDDPERKFSYEWKGWRAFLGLEEIETYSFDETQKFVWQHKILTEHQYSFFAAAILKDGKRLPPLEDLRAQGLLEAIRLRPYEQIPKEERGRVDDAFIEYYNFVQHGDRFSTSKKKEGVYGVSDYIASPQERSFALEQLYAMARGELESHTDSTVYNEVFNLARPKSVKAAKKILGEFIDELQTAGLLTKEFFTPDILHPVCMSIIGSINDDFYPEVKDRIGQVVVGKPWDEVNGDLRKMENINIETIPEYSLEETRKLIKDLMIQSPNEYAFFSAVVFPDGKRLPTIYELYDSSSLEKLGLISYEELKQKKGGDISASISDRYLQDVFSLYTSEPKIMPGYVGISKYVASERERERALDELIALSKEEVKSVLGPDSGGNDWKDVYGLEFPEAIQDAKNYMTKIINRLEKDRLLTKEFFELDVYHVFCEWVLYRVHNDYFGSSDNAEPGSGGRRILRARKGPRKGKLPGEA